MVNELDVVLKAGERKVIYSLFGYWEFKCRYTSTFSGLDTENVMPFKTITVIYPKNDALSLD